MTPFVIHSKGLETMSEGTLQEQIESPNVTFRMQPVSDRINLVTTTIVGRLSAR